MVLPDICPQNNDPHCRGKQCYLYHIDWRTGEENCSIAYGHDRKGAAQNEPVRDTYAEDAKKRLGYRSEPKVNEGISGSPTLEKVPIKEEKEIVAQPSEIKETVVLESKDTTVIESHISETTPAEDSSQKENAEKKKKLDRMMDMEDISEDYEKSFWK